MPYGKHILLLFLALTLFLPVTICWSQDKGKDDEPFLLDEEEEEPFLPNDDDSLRLGEDQPIADEPFLLEDQPTSIQDDEDNGSTPDFLTKIASFKYRYRLQGGVNNTDGLFTFLTGKDKVQEYRLLNSYQQTIRIEESPSKYNFVKFSIDFYQNYEAESEQFFDNSLVLNEIYLNFRQEKQQFRWGNQVFNLGKVDFDSPIDRLHYQNITGLLTFDTENTKQSLTSLKYDRFWESRTLTLYVAPIAQRTFGMRFTQFREDSELRDAERDPEGSFLLRDYFGIQHQWHGETTDLRLGFFHWFDNDPELSWEFIRSTSNGQSDSFQGLINSFTEKESQVNYFTLEIDSVLGTVGWKLDLGIFDDKNYYDYQISSEEDIHFKTVSLPSIGLATSLERTFPFFFTLVIFSADYLQDVPENTHILFFENEDKPIDHQRDLAQGKLTGVFIWQIPENNQATLAISGSAPFGQRTIFGIWQWEIPHENIVWSLKAFHVETDIQKMTDKAVVSNQVFLTYTQNFSGL